jgi:hypothetical protein
MVVKMADEWDGIAVDLLDVYLAVKLVVNWDVIVVAL